MAQKKSLLAPLWRFGAFREGTEGRDLEDMIKHTQRSRLGFQLVLWRFIWFLGEVPKSQAPCALQPWELPWLGDVLSPPWYLGIYGWEQNHGKNDGIGTFLPKGTANHSISTALEPSVCPGGCQGRIPAHVPALRCPWAGGDPRALKQGQGMGFTHSWHPAPHMDPSSVCKGRLSQKTQPGHSGKT